MKGIVFNLLGDMVESRYGIAAWDALLQTTGQDGVYVATESYPDAQLYDLVGAASNMTGIDAGELIPAFGRYMIPSFARDYPGFFGSGMRLRDFLLTVDQVVHVEVRKLYPGAGLPTFHYNASSPDRLRMDYRSPRRLCALAVGLIEGAAEHFGEACTIGHDVCMHKGDTHCELDIHFHVH